MAKQISKGQALGGFNSDLDEAISKIGSLDTAIHALDSTLKVLQADAGKLRKEIGGIDVSNVKGIKELNAKQQEANKIRLDSIRIEQQQQKLLIDKERLTQAMIRTEKLKNQESKKTLTAYQQESRALTEMRNRYKDLSVQKMNGIKLTKEEEKEYRRLIPQIRQTDAALKKIDATGGQFQRSVGNYPKVINGFKNALGQLGVAFGVFQLAAGFGKTLVNFEEQAANMAKTLGTTVEEAKGLSRELANIDTRTSISDLQVIAAIGGQLGETKDTIVEFTGAIDQLNVALGDEFTGGAEEVTSTLGGLRNVLTDIKSDNSADDLLKIGNALNVLGAEGTATAPVVSDFAGRISGIGIPLGLTSEQVLGLSATLQELNVNAERGGTAVGSILQKMTRDTKSFAELAGLPVKDFEELLNKDLLGAFKLVTKGFSTLEGNAVKQSQVLEKLGLTGSGASEVFLKLGNSVGLLDTRVSQAGEALKNTESITDEFNVKNNTLGATIEKITKDFQKYVIGVDESGMVTGGLSSSLQFLHDNFNTIVEVVKQAVKMFVLYKATLTTMNVAQKLFGDGTGKLNISLKQLVSNMKDGASASQKLGQALKGVGFTAIIALATELVTELKHIASGALVAEQRLKRLAEFTSLGMDVGTKLSEKYNQSLDKRLKAIDLLNVSEAEQTRLRKQAIEANKLSIQQRLVELRQTHATIDAQRQRAVLERDRFKREFSLVSSTTKQKIRFAELENAVSDITAAEKGYLEMIKALESNLGSLGDKTHDLNVEEKNLTVSTGKQGKAVKELNTQLEAQNRYLSREVELRMQLLDIHTKNSIKSKQTELDTELNKQVSSALKTGEFDNMLVRYKFLLSERTKLEQLQIQNDARFRIESLEKTLEEEQEKELQSIILNRDKLLQQEGLTSDQKAFIEQQYQDQLKKLDNDRKKRLEDFEREKLIILDESADKQLEVVKQGDQDLITAKEKTLDAQKEFLDELGTATIEKTEKNYDNERKYIELTTKFWEDQIDKRIAKLNELTEASKKEQQNLQELANSGNIKAQQSIAREAEIQREAEKEKAKLEQRKLYLQAFSAFMTNYTNRLEKGEDSTQALAGAVADKTVLEAILATLPAFFDGADRLNANGRGVDGIGGFLAINHPDERIVPKKENDKLVFDNGRDIPNEMLPSIVSQWKAGIGLNMMDVKTIEKSSDQQIIQKLDELNNTIKNQPDRYPEFEQTVKGVFHLYFNEKKGNKSTRTINQYRTKG